MAIFLTEYRDRYGRRWVGPNIPAPNRAEAERTLDALRDSVTIVGVLVETIDYETGKRTIYAPPQEER
jgi:hypothetical protein